MNKNLSFIVGVKKLNKMSIKTNLQKNLSQIYDDSTTENDMAEEYKEALLLRRITFQTAVCNARLALLKTALKSTAL